MSFSFPFQKIQKIKSTHRIVVHVQRDDIMRLDQYQALSKNPKYQLLQWQSRHIQFKIVNLKKKKKKLSAKGWGDHSPAIYQVREVVYSSSPGLSVLLCKLERKIQGSLGGFNEKTQAKCWEQEVCVGSAQSKLRALIINNKSGPCYLYDTILYCLLW